MKALFSILLSALLLLGGCALAEESEMDVFYQPLVLANKTDKTLKNVQFQVHLRQTLQMALVTPDWYNEPINLGTAGQDKTPSAVVYTWQPCVLPGNLAAGAEPADFYDMLLEITWQGGREIIRLDEASVCMPQQVNTSVPQGEALDEAEIAHILELGKAK